MYNGTKVLGVKTVKDRSRLTKLRMRYGIVVCMYCTGLDKYLSYVAESDLPDTIGDAHY